MPTLKRLILLSLLLLLTVFVSGCTLSQTPLFAAPVPLPTEAPPSMSERNDVLDSPDPTPVSTPDVTPSPLTQDDILSYLQTRFSESDLSIENATPVGDNLLLVEFWSWDYSQYVLCHTDTGVYEFLDGWDLALKKVVSPDYFIFERKGEFEEGAFFPFPYIVHCFRVKSDGDEYASFKSVTEPECFELGRSVQAGSKESDMLTAVIVGLEGCQLLFGPADGEAGLAYGAAATYIPATVTAYDADTNTFVVELKTCQMSADLEAGTEIKTDTNGYISSYIITEDEGNVYISVTLTPQAAGYMISTVKVPDGDEPDGFPVINIRFTNKDYLDFKQAW